MNEQIARSLNYASKLALGLAIVAMSSHTALASNARSALAVSVQVIDPCEVILSPDGSWISFGCAGASFEFSTFTTATAVAPAVSSSVEGVEFVDVTY